MNTAKTALEVLEDEMHTMNPAGNKRTIDDYFRIAKEVQNISSYRELARRLGLSSTSVNDMRHGKILPSDETMLEIAKLCDLPPAEALLDLCVLRASGEARKEYEAIFGKYKKLLVSLFPATLLGVIMAVPKDAFASVDRALTTLPPALWECVVNCYNIVYYGN